MVWSRTRSQASTRFALALLLSLTTSIGLPAIAIADIDVPVSKKEPSVTQERSTTGETAETRGLSYRSCFLSPDKAAITIFWAK
jgi:hypothetical protein